MLPSSRGIALACLPLLAVGLTACGGNEGGEGEESVTIRLAHHLPETHFVVEESLAIFMQNAEQAAQDDGREIKFEVFPAEQLGAAADQIENLKNGVFDAGLVMPPYNPDQMPLSNAFNLPNIADSSEQLTQAYYEVAMDRESAIYQEDFEKNELVPFATIALPPYRVAMTEPIDGLADLTGKNIRSGGAAQNDTIKALGATPVVMTAAEQYEGLQRGTLDGGLFNTPSMLDNKTAEVTEGFASNANLGGFSGAIVVSASALEDMPDWVEETLTEAGKAATDNYAEKVDGLGEDANEILVSEYGLKEYEFTDSELATISELLKPVEQSWLDSVEGRGAGGEAALTEARSALENVSP